MTSGLEAALTWFIQSRKAKAVVTKVSYFGVHTGTEIFRCNDVGDL